MKSPREEKEGKDHVQIKGTKTGSREEEESSQEQRGQRRKGHRQRLKGCKEWRGKGDEGGGPEGQERWEEGKTCVQHH